MDRKGTSSVKLLVLLLVPLSWTASSSDNSLYDAFVHCLSHHSNPSSSHQISSIVYSPNNNSSFTTLLQSYIRSRRFITSTTPKPLLIVAPLHETHVQATVICSRKAVVQLKIRSGGHDYEGISSTSTSTGVPFIILDLFNLRSIAVDLNSETAWVQSGATIGELYHEIAATSKVHAFPAGMCSTVGVGGHLGGGGFGTLLRKYGLAVDNVVDARIVDVNGVVLDRKAMGEDLFWAIRGGGSPSFGVVLSYKIRLVPVPEIVTVFWVEKTLEQGATKLLHKWQIVAHELPDDVFLVSMGVLSSANGDQLIAKKAIKVIFMCLFLGGTEKLLSLMNDSFPELGLRRKDCIEMSWIESVLYFDGFSYYESNLVLLNRTQRVREFYKGKSDYVEEPIPESGLEELWNLLLDQQVDEASVAGIVFLPYGGKMNEISDSETPFPHRKGNMYKIEYSVAWETEEATETLVEWIRRVYAFMTPYVSKSPRSSYLNFRDFDLGVNNVSGNTSYEEASVWGLKYFKSNFKRLAHVKAKVDPGNFFRDEQSIPILFPSDKEKETRNGWLGVLIKLITQDFAPMKKIRWMVIKFRMAGRVPWKRKSLLSHKNLSANSNFVIKLYFYRYIYFI